MQRSRFVDRIGAVLASPARALAEADRPESAGRAPSDLALLILAAFVAVHLDAVLRGGWLIGAGEIGDGFGVVIGRLGTVLQAPLIALLAGVVLIAAAAGRKRNIGRDSDLACAAFVPAVLAVVVGALVQAIAGHSPWIQRGAQIVGLACYAVVALLAISQARARPEPNREAVQGRSGSGAELGRFRRDSDHEPWRGGRSARVAGLAAAAVIAGLLVVNSARLASNWSQIRPKISGDNAPAFALPRIEAKGELGAKVSLTDLRGKILIVDFWATWCGPCRTSMPHLEILAKRPDVELVSINIEGADKRELAREMVDRLAPSALLLGDTNGRIADIYGVSTLPHLAVIDAEGVIRDVHRGGIVTSVREELGSIIDGLAPASP